MQNKTFMLLLLDLPLFSFKVSGSLFVVFSMVWIRQFSYVALYNETLLSV